MASVRLFGVYFSISECLRHVSGAACPNAYPRMEILTLKSSTDSVSLIQSAPFEFFANDKQPSNGYLHRDTPIYELDRNAIILHSSGSTGLPKPIYHAHEYLLNYATCHQFLPGEDTTRVCTSTLPLFHVSLFDLESDKWSLIPYVF